MTSIIEQADAIVGITTDVIMANGKADTYRRGAYASWYAKNSQPDQWPTVAETIESQAERIVRLHKPKGDGLPEIHGISFAKHWSGRNGELVFSCHGPITDAQHAKACSEYIMRCLAPPVRRLLAAFEVVEQPSAQTLADDGERYIRITARGRALDWSQVRYGEDSIVCWLVPRGER